MSTFEAHAFLAFVVFVGIAPVAFAILVATYEYDDTN